MKLNDRRRTIEEIRISQSLEDIIEILKDIRDSVSSIENVLSNVEIIRPIDNMDIEEN